MNSTSVSILEMLGISADVLASRGLVAYEEATELEVAEVGEDGREHLLIPAAAAAWRAMKEAAFVDNIDLLIVSAFRSIARQSDIIRRKLDAGWGVDEILSVCAAPGYSEHHTGRAIDISAPGGPLLETDFEKTDAFKWLQANADRFGYFLSYPAGNSFGYQYEPWHWCFAPSAVNV